MDSAAEPQSNPGLLELEKETPDKDSATGDGIGATEATPAHSLAPDGGFRAWMAAVGSSCVLFCTMGFMNSSGVFQAYYMTTLLAENTPDDIAWIISLQAFLIFFCGILGGPLFDRFGVWTLRPAAVLYVLSFIATSFCIEYWHFMLSQGVLMGVSNGMLMFPSMAALSHWWDKSRGKAMGIAIAGSSAGGIVWPAVLTQLFDSSLGFGWSMRICGLAMIPILTIAFFATTARLPPKQTTLFTLEPFRNKVFLALITAQFLLFMGMFVPIFYLAAYAENRGMSSTLAAYLIAILNGASLPGRIIPGVLADKFGRLNILFASGLSTGIVILCWNQATTDAGIIVYAVVFGFCSGAIISGGSVALTVATADPTKTGTYLGMGMATVSIAVLITPPINGAILDQYGGFSQISTMNGILCLGGTAGILVTKMVSKEGIWSRS
ncbi:monocarboxylate permease-like protein [Zalerion maritima]|uniref:Monocarboxylate permease-like protein n=1 Tax=Zalerion maritima TaxID=339359 RepID=A0AAD5S595_9PEZI|nr:monocarboxylate permease-like protein [Zalerion maritima]